MIKCGDKIAATIIKSRGRSSKATCLHRILRFYSLSHECAMRVWYGPHHALCPLWNSIKIMVVDICQMNSDAVFGVFCLKYAAVAAVQVTICHHLHHYHHRSLLLFIMTSRFFSLNGKRPATAWGQMMWVCPIAFNWKYSIWFVVLARRQIRILHLKCLSIFAVRVRFNWGETLEMWYTIIIHLFNGWKLSLWIVTIV